MAKLTLTLACTQTDRSAPLLDGRVAPDGCEIVPLPGQTQDIFRRVLNDQAFDIAEMSMSSQIVQASRGVQHYVTLPVYLSRTFRHSALYIRTDRGIARPEELKGKRIGIEQFQQTVGLWVRGILGDEHGVRTQDVQWITGGLEQPGGGERLKLRLPEGISVTPAPAGKTLSGMLAVGELDALIGSRAPSCFERRADGVGRMFPDYRQAEMAYYARTRHFPIMHCVVLRRSLVDQHPWLPVEVFRAFVRAKAIALQELFLLNIPRISLAWIAEDAKATQAALGGNLWPYGLNSSRHEIDSMLRYAANDGLTERALSPEALFHPSTHDLPDHA